jgi:hypothetical protein
LNFESLAAAMRASRIIAAGEILNYCQMANLALFPAPAQLAIAIATKTNKNKRRATRATSGVVLKCRPAPPRTPSWPFVKDQARR